VVDTATGIATAVANGTTTISATTSGVSGSTVVTVNQVAIQLAFTTPPSTAAAGVVIAPPVAIAAQDARGNPVAGFTDLVTIAIGANPGGSVLSGTTAKNAVGGVVQFTDLRLDQPGTQYTLVASTPALPPITSVPFDVGAALATVYWTNASGGLWSTASNWSTGAVPGSGDNAVISAVGTYSVTLDVDATLAGLTIGGPSGTQTLVVQNHTLTVHGAGTVNPNGAIQVSSGTVGGTGLLTNKGLVQVYYSTIASPLALRNEALLTTRGSGYFNGPLTTIASSTFRVEGDAFCCASYAYVANGFINNGTIELTAINGTGTYSTLSVTDGTLVNAAGAAINVLAGTGGVRQLDVELDNRGTVSIGQSTTMNRGGSNHLNSGTVNLSGGGLTLYQYASPTQGSFTNTGTITVAAAETLKVSYGEFRYNSGTLSGAGIVAIESATLALGQGLSNAVTALSLNSATVNGPGTLTNALGKNLVAYYSTINAPLDNQGLLTLRATTTLNGAVSTASGSTLRVEGDAFCCAAYATVANGFTNNGTIELTAINGTGTYATLNVTNGTLVNSSGASINMLAGTGGQRELNAELNNQGTVTIGAPTAMNRGVSNHVNSGSLDVSGANLSIYQYASPTMGSFTNSGTGSITVAAAETLKVTYGEFRYSAGTVGGAGLIDLTSATLTLGQGLSNGAVALVLNSATVNGPGTLTNAAIKSLVLYGSTVNAPLHNQGLLTLRGFTTLNGAVTIAAGSTLRVEGDAFCCSAYATVENGFTNNGTIELTAVNSTGTSARLGVNNGTLVNAAGASINVLPGAGGSRQLDVELNNQGTVTVGATTSMNRGVSNHANSGTINVSGGNLSLYQYASPTQGSFTNTGTVTVAAAETLQVQYGELRYNSGTLGGNGTVAIENGVLTLGQGFSNAVTTLTLNSATVNGPGTLTNTAAKTLVVYQSTINAPLDNQGLLKLRGTSTINGALTTASASTLLVEGDAFCCSAYATVLNGFTNTGTIDLTAINSSGTSARLGVTNGTLVNAPGALINLSPGMGGSRQLDVELDNRGTVTVAAPTQMNRGPSNHVNSGTLDVSGGDLSIYQYAFPTQGSFTNTGTVTVAAAETLDVTYGEFRYDGGSLGGAGTLELNSVTAGNFDLAHTLAAVTFNSSTANFDFPQSTANTVFVLNSSTVNGPGALTNVSGKTLVVYQSTINAPLDNQGLLTLRGSSTLNGPVTTATSSILRVEGDAFCCGAFATITNGFTNNGTIDLTAVNATGTTARLGVTNGTLVNALGASINVLPGTGGSRQLDAQLDNQGTVTIAASTTMNRTNPVHVNSGTLDVSGDLTLNQFGGSFTNGGTATIGAGQKWILNNGSFTHTGTLGGTGALELNSVTAADFDAAHTLGAITLNSSTASFTTDQSTASTDFTLFNSTVNGPGILTNATGRALTMSHGTINAPLANQGLLTLRGSTTLNGAITTAPASIIRVEGDAFYAGSFATVDAGFINTGTIELTAINGGGTSSQLTVTNGVLDNIGTINALAGDGGSRALNAALNNQGTMRIEQPLTMGRPSSIHTNSGTLDIAGDLTLNQSGTASFTNMGAINIGTGRTWTVNGGDWTSQDPGTLTGDSLILNSVGSAAFNSSQSLKAITLSNTTAGFLGDQNTDVTTFTFTSSTVNGPGTFTNAGGKTLVMNYGKMNAAFNNNGLFTLRGSAEVNGVLTTATGSTLRVEGDASYASAFATIATGFTNKGTLELTSIKGPIGASLSVTSGTLLNTGTIDAAAGTGGNRALDAVLNNQGPMSVGTNLTITKADAVHTNGSSIGITGGNLTINQSGGNPSFTNVAGGFIDIATGLTLRINTGNVTNAVNGRIQGKGTLDITGTTFFNDGELIPGASPGILTIAGGAPLLGGTSTVSIELGGPTLDTEYDQLVSTSAITLSGTLDVKLINGYDPTGKAVTFTVVAGNNGGSRFGIATVPPNCNQPQYTSTTVTVFCN
jgi:hypothetical protein